MYYYQSFIISSYSRNPETCQAFLNYSFDDQLHFQEVLDFRTDQTLANTHIPDIHTILTNIHIALGLSYYKLYPYADIVIQTTSLTDVQLDFWQQFYRAGLGEYCARNDVNPQDIVHMRSESDIVYTPLTHVHTIDRGLVGIGGGKDSIVSTELLKAAHYDFSLISIGKYYQIHHEVAQLIGKPLLSITRTLDPLLFQLNTQDGYYNGHVPITGMLAWIKILTAYLYGYRAIIISNEKSANEGNLVRHGMEVNHQRSKSLEFEYALHQYMCEFVTDQITYFSLLRGMYEIAIVKLFSRRPQYFSTFSSCNHNFKLSKTTDSIQKVRWCNHCPKCAFVYAMLRPWIDTTQVIQIWGKELYEDADLIPVYQQLLGISGHKPWECVGTNEEMTLSMYQTWIKTPELHQTPIMQLFADKIIPNLTPEVVDDLQHKLYHIETSDMIPTSLRDRIRQVIDQ